MAIMTDLEGLPDQPKDQCGSRDGISHGATAALADDVWELTPAAIAFLNAIDMLNILRNTLPVE